MTAAPPRWWCEKYRCADRCEHDWCPNWIPPVAGDFKRRLPVCARAIGDYAAASGGLSNPDAAWLLGIAAPSAWRVEQRALGKLRKVVARDD